MDRRVEMTDLRKGLRNGGSVSKSDDGNEYGLAV